MNLDLLTNATVVDNAIRFVSSNQSKTTSPPSSNEGNKGESNEPDYNEDENSDKEGEEKQEEESGEIALTTTANQVF